ncbi:MAG TPA: tetratricopeptide repeat protein [Candidatus Sulfotelmatobacter sp.]|nr:tetratricopeptide repeat protein [Candidatus Sulfotelmatobacter sp.]
MDRLMDRLSVACCFLSFSFLFAMPSGGKLEAAQGHAPSTPAENATTGAASAPQKLFGTIGVSTRSEEARKYLELSIDKYENGLLDDAAVHAQHAVEKDPHFALGYAFLSYVARRGVPDSAALARAKALLPSATPDEQLLVRWMTGVQDSDLLPAIVSMNELLTRFPKDKHVLFLTSEWLYAQQDYDRARQLMEKTLKVDANFAPVLNRLGHAYIESDTPDPAKAIAALKRYLELQPGQPTPEVSLAEVLRSTGDDHGSLEHYTEALQLDPTSFASRVGLADTLALTGDFANAREQYDKAIGAAQSPRDRFHAECQKRLVFFWEGQPDKGRKALLALSDEAKSQKQGYAEAEIGFARVLLAAESDEELLQLESLEALLRSPVVGMSESDRNISLAAIWREQARVHALLGQAKPAADAVRAIGDLATKTRDPIVENIYESGHGYELIAEGDLANAADELAADPQNPLVVRQLILTQEKLGNSGAADAIRARLKYLRTPTAEWYLVSHAAPSNAAAVLR